MSKSIDFCKQRIKSGDFDLDFLPGVTCHETDTLGILETMFEKISCITKNGVVINNNFRIIYNPNAEFDYLTYLRTRHDGTLLFTLQNMQGVLWKVFNGETYCKTKVPDDYLDNFQNYNTTYTIGNIVTVTEYSKDFGTIEKPWMMQRDTAMLPIKFEVRKID